MTKLIRLLLILCPVFAYTQLTQLTDIGQGGTNFKHDLISVGDKNYILQTDQEDVVYTYELTTPTTRVLLHSHKVPGSYQNYRRATPSRVTAGFSNQFHTYDFITDNLTSVVLPEEYYYVSVWQSNGTQYILQLRHSQTNDYLYVLYDPVVGIKVLETSYSEIFDGQAIKREDVGIGLNQYVLYDYLQESYDTLLTHSERVSFVEYEGSLYYSDSLGVLNTYDLTTKESIALLDTGLGSHQIYSGISNQYLVLSSSKASGNQNLSTIKVYDLNNTLLVNETNLLDRHLILSFEIIEDLVVSSAPLNEKLFVYNYLENTQILTDSDSYIYSGLINDNFLLHCYDAFGLPDIFCELINTTTMETSRIDLGSLPWGYRGGPSIVDGSTLITRVDNNYIYYDFSTSTLQTTVLEEFDDSKSGLLGSTVLEPFLDGIIISSDSLYHYSNQSGFNTVTKLGNLKSFNVYKDVLYFQDENGNALSAYDGGSKTVVLDSIPYIKSMTSSANYLFIVTDNNLLLRFDPTTREVIETSVNHDSGSLYTLDDQAFYSSGNNLYLMAQDGSLTLLTDSLLVSFNEAFNINGDLLFVLLDGLYRYENASLSLLTNGVFQDWSTFVSTDENDAHLIIYSDTNTIHYTDSSLFSIALDNIRTVANIGNQHFLVNYSSNGVTQTAFYDATTKEVIEPPLDENIIQHYIYDNTEYLISRTGPATYNIYEIDSTFTIVAEIDNLEMPSGFITSITHMPSELFMRLGDGYAIGTGTDYRVLENIKGEFANHQEPILINDKVFFLANDAEDGLQLFSYQEGTTSVTDYNNSLDKNLIIYPNPTNDQVSLSLNEGPITFDYSLYTTDHRLIKSGEGKQSISLYDLPAGTYVLVIACRNSIQTRKIIKQ